MVNKHHNTRAKNFDWDSGEVTDRRSLGSKRRTVRNKRDPLQDGGVVSDPSDNYFDEQRHCGGGKF